ncbi:uncharacterized protein [Lolium perenne]|uniref:uncharacterized protein n=1 Tax=Lolium perenne TaxID=4522 RepID=UPI0021F5EAC9|nr:uncharacterized protein LOC127335696 [Lolium perenne]XP_051218377.1 uncharacterized protein LOC127335696 [Lolium perenne]
MADVHEKGKQIGEEQEEEEEYVLLELDDYLYSDIQPNAPYILSGLDTLTPTLIVGDGLKMVGEYEETVGTCYLFSERDAPPKPVRDGTAPLKEKKDKQASNSKEAPAPSKEVKQLASVQKILRFRSVGENHQEHRTYQHEGREF